MKSYDKNISLSCPAKINLFLHVMSRRPGGYHNLFSVAAFTAFGDILTISPASHDSICLSGPFGDVLQDAGGDTLITQILSALRQTGITIPPLLIEIEKNIPLGGGLGGGSADAAGLLRALISAQLIKDNSQELIDLSAPIGADIPVCLKPQLQIMRSTGNELEPLTPPQLMPFCVVANPGFHISTSTIFAMLDIETGRQEADCTTMTQNADWSGLLALGNDLTAAATALHPQITELLDHMNSLGRQSKGLFYGAAMSGSGSSCFALCEKLADAVMISQALKQSGIWSVASPLLR